MPRDLPIGNGALLVAFDPLYRLSEFYFPRVGMENQAAAKFRFAVWCDDALHETDGPSWHRTLEYLRDTLVTDVQLQNDAIGLRIRCYDAVDPDARVYIRKFVVRNLRDDKRELKLFLHHEFALYGNPIGDTVMYDPASGGLIQYKARRYVLINCEGGVAEYECARSATSGADGSWRDAADGTLSMSAIAQGSVDATIAIPLTVGGGETATAFHWICAGRTDAEVRAIDEQVRAEGAARILARTGSHWYTWVNKSGIQLSDLPDEITDFYRRSLLVISTQCDRGGAVLAANDSDIVWGHNDHYSYVWPRDAVFVCDAMDRAGFPEITRRFLTFANDVIRDDGYFLHKYNPDGSLAPLWHAWVHRGEPRLPIQLDETALVVWLVARHYDRTRDLDLLRSIYAKLVISAADFLVQFRDPETALPRPTFDMWEERYGVFTFTTAAVWAALTAAADLANLFNDQEKRATYQKAAGAIREAMRQHLWLESEGRYARGLVEHDGKLVIDDAVDASLFAVFYFGVFPASTAMVEGTMRAIREKLWVHTETGGVARYEGDAYHRISEETERVPGNPWILCTLWLAEHVIAKATDRAGLQRALDLVRWARARATRSMVLPEQIDPYGGDALSVSPLTWSHAQVISVIHGYLDALHRFR